MYGAVFTSDGVVHFVDNEEELVAILDEYGPEVVSCERFA